MRGSQKNFPIHGSRLLSAALPITFLLACFYIHPPQLTGAYHPKAAPLSFSNTNLYDASALRQAPLNTQALPESASFVSHQPARVQVPFTFIVDTTGDGPDASPGDGICADAIGSCTLRAALQEATENVGADSIYFNIPGEGPHVIVPLSALPLITETVTIDGYTQPGAVPNTNPAPLGLNTQLQIELDGSLAGSASGLGITFPLGYVGDIDGLMIRGLAIHSFSGAGIVVSSEEDNPISNVSIQGNFLGTDSSGTQAKGNFMGVTFGYFTYNGLVGGASPEDRNLISGNSMYGVALKTRFSDSPKVVGNLIGTDVYGNAALPNHAGGILIDDAAPVTIGGTSPSDTNLISGNGGPGIFIPGSPYGPIWVQGNIIGADHTGLSPLGNAGSGIYVFWHNLTTIGGQTEYSQNIIAFNAKDGITLAFPEYPIEILKNSIGSNGDLGIDLGDDGVSTGLYPLLTNVKQLPGGGIEVSGVSAGPVVDIFANASCDPTGFGEGEIPLTTEAVTGIFSITLEVPAGNPFITATDSHSEFSVCMADPLILVDDLQGIIQQLVAEGELAPAYGQRLAAYLRGVDRALRADHPDRAIAYLLRFDRAVRSLVHRGLLTMANGQVLLDASAEILRQITLQQASL